MDVNAPASSSDADPQPGQDPKDPTSATGSSPDTQDGGEGTEGHEQAVPYARFQTVNRVANWYRENFGDPKEAARLLELKRQADAPKPKPAAGEGGAELSEEDRRTAIREVMRSSAPKEFAALEEIVNREQLAEEVMLDRAEDSIREYTSASKLPKTESFVLRFGRMVMEEIKHDDKLLRRWQARDGSVIKDACSRVTKEFVDPVRSNANGKSVADKRRVASLPTPPAGGRAVGSGPAPKKDDDRGITKSSHDRAWDRLQQLTAEE